jgi:hypothetical protein
MRNASIGVFVFSHAALFLLPAMMIALLTPSPPSFGQDIFVRFIAVFNTWVALLSVILQFYPQISKYRHLEGDPGVFSLSSTGMQAIVLLSLAIRRLLRLGHTT